MLHTKLVAFISLVTFLFSCAIYDTERGVFVSSSAQTIDAPISAGVGKPILLLPFNPPKESLVGKDTHIVITAGAYAEANFSYRFDAIDQANLRKSILNSIKSGDSPALIDVSPETDAAKLEGAVIGIVFNQAGIISGLSTKCLIDTVRIHKA